MGITKPLGKISLTLQKAPVTIFLIWSVCLLGPFAVLAFEKPAEIMIPGAVNPGLQHLLDLADPDKNVAFDPQKVVALLNFVGSPKDNGAIYYANIIRGLTSAYHEFDIHRNLESVVDYAFNPDIPGIATSPSSMRLFKWLDLGGKEQAHPKVGQYLKSIRSPVAIRGRQYVEITPDLTSGAYYGYTLHYILLLFKYKERNIIVTVSKQADVSTVGEKGYILGSDADWDYFYSGKTGLTLPALGWVKSYMYDSRGINLYDEIDPAGPVVRCASFNWLRAGWSGINMVQKKHIFRGLKRFASAYKTILDSPLLPPAAKLADDFARIRGLSREDLRTRMKIYFNILKKRYGSGRRNSKKWPSKLIENKIHWQRMTKEEMESVLIIEYIKYALGKTRKEEVGELLGLKH